MSNSPFYPLMSVFDIYKKSLSIWQQTHAICLGSPEVISHRLNLFNPPSGHGKNFPYLEFQSMWQEKMKAWVLASSAFNLSVLGMLPIFSRPHTARAATEILTRQLSGLNATLKPYSSQVTLNQKRLRKKTKSKRSR